jgi:hypothetical protein
MQASLPSMVRMVAVEDIGQGSEALRILGIRWLPTGAAARSVGSDGNLKSSGEEKDDRKAPDDGEGEGQNEAPGQDEMEAEDGDFVNAEIAFAYRPSTGKGIKSRAKHAHLLLAFYLPGNVKLREFKLPEKPSFTNATQLSGSNWQAWLVLCAFDSSCVRILRSSPSAP